MTKLKARDQLAAWREVYPAPCQAACPVHTDARTYVTLTGRQAFEDAYLVARRPNPLPGICGKACSAPCEDVCTRGEFDRPVRIRQIKRFLAGRYEAETVSLPMPTGKSVAIIGSGPGGLSAAHDLALLGHKVTIFEAATEPGGMATLGVPRFRLGISTIREDIEPIVKLGVTIETGVYVGREVTLADLRREFDAVLIATGATRLNDLNVPGQDLDGVVQALPYLRDANLGGRPPTGSRVAVIGGGYTAMDAARTAVRLGAQSVRVLYRRTRHETEVHEDELEQTVREGVQIEYLVTPVRLIGDRTGNVTAIECRRNRLGEPDASGRPRPVPIEGTEFEVDVDMVLLAIGQGPHAGDIDADAAGALEKVDSTMMTAVPGVFAAGDFVSGPSTIIEAIRDGRAAAASIDAFLVGSRSNGVESRREPAFSFGARPRLVRSGRVADSPDAVLALEREVEEQLSYDDAVREGLRCLYCGLLPSIVLDDCTLCHACTQVCPVDCIYPVGVDESTGAVFAALTYRDATSYVIDAERCIRCGRCFGACPVGAITVET